MTVVAPPSEEMPGRHRIPWGDRTFRAVALGAGLLVLVVLGLIAYTTTREAWPAFRHEGLSFVTSKTWDPANNHFGALALIYGTLVTSLIALVLAVPMSLGIALYTVEMASHRMRSLVTYVIDLLAAVPSVVYGYWALVVFTSPASGVYQKIADSIGTLPVLSSVFGGPVSRGQAGGSNFMTAGIILAVMITPIVTSLSREVLATVAQDDKNAAIAMGATRWEMLRTAVFPRVRGGLVGAVMLGLGRAMGETIAVTLVIGSRQQVTSHLFRPGDTLASAIAHDWGEGQGADLWRAALIGLGVLLFVLTILINAAARAIVNRSRTVQANA